MSAKRPATVVGKAGGSVSRSEGAQERFDVSYGSRCLDAFTVALSQAYDRQRWYTSTKELQLASLPFCVACRSVATLHLRVDDDTPSQLLGAADSRLHLGLTRVPRLRARRVSWYRSCPADWGDPVYTLVDVFEFRGGFNSSIEDVAWPVRLRVLNMGYSFNQPVASVSWPPSLKELDFGGSFNQVIDGVAFPPSLQRLKFGNDFNQPISDVSWPENLQELDFGGDFSGGNFDQPIEGITWPSSLECICFSDCFDQPIAGVSWPTSLTSLFFGDDFNQPIADVTWPPDLRLMVFGYGFNQPVARVAWPASLEDLAFGICCEDLDTSLYVASCFDQALHAAVWPVSMRELTLGVGFEQSLQGLGKWMPNLESLTLMVEDYSLLVGIEWPKRLKKLVVDRDRNMAGVDIPRSVEVSYLPEW